MFTLSRSATRITALAVLLGTTALAAPSFAADASDTGSMRMKSHHEEMMSPEKMKEAVETRIKTLHDKLMITPEQEDQWNAVAQAMRDNETSTSGLIQERHKNAATMTAVEDLQSYQGIAQSHADGLKNVIAAFSALYDNMSDDQKKNADKVFGTFEGHMGDHAGKSKPKSM